MKKVTRTVIGVVLIVLGLVALLTPFSPGSWLILVGLEFLGLRILLENKLRRWTEARPNSRLARMIRRLLRLRPRNKSARDMCGKAKETRKAS